MKPEVVFITTPIDRQVVGTDINIKCTIRGDPLTNIQWTKIDGPLSSYGENVATDFQNSSVTHLTNDLMIISATEDSHGTYRCSASNIHGSVYADVDLNFFSKFGLQSGVSFINIYKLTSC